MSAQRAEQKGRYLLTTADPQMAQRGDILSSQGLSAREMFIQAK